MREGKGRSENRVKTKESNAFADPGKPGPEGREGPVGASGEKGPRGTINSIDLWAMKFDL